MPDDVSGHEVDHALGDIPQQVPHSFEFACDSVDEEVVGRHAWIVLDKRGDLVEREAVEFVDGAVLFDDGSCELRIGVNDGAEELLTHERDAFTHFAERFRPLWLGLVNAMDDLAD